MPIATVSCSIKGTSPILMHAFPMVAIDGLEKKTPAEQAEISAYRDPKTRNLFIPGTALQRCLVSAASYSKGKGRSTLVRQVAACVFVTPDHCDLGTDTYVVDSRPVVVPATKGRVVRHRPRLDEWAVSFTIDYDDTLLSEKELRARGRQCRTARRCPRLPPRAQRPVRTVHGDGVEDELG